MNNILNSGFSDEENIHIKNFSVDELFLYDTILSEHNRQGIKCKIYDFVANLIQSRCKKKIIVPNDTKYPNRFKMFEAIDSTIKNEIEKGQSVCDNIFNDVKKNIENFLELRNSYLIEIIKKPGTFKEKLWGLNFLIEKYAFETGEHTEEVGIISKRLAREINNRFNRNIDLENFTEFGHFHDLGKLLIPADILLKPGKLTSEEFEIIKKHSIYGSILIKIILLYSDDNYLEETRKYADSIIKIALYHHKTNTAGYPQELSTENITIESEIVRITDIFHALVSKRVYKTKIDTAEVWQIIANMEGTFKYPEVYDIFIEIKEEMLQILKERNNPNKTFEILGNEIIDSDHIAIQNQLDRVIESSDKKVLSEYKKLIKIIGKHFKTEEKLSLKYNFPDYLNLKKTHDEILIRSSFIRNDNIEDISNEFIKRFINEWLRKTIYIHNKTIDSKLVKHIEEVQLRKGKK